MPVDLVDAPVCACDSLAVVGRADALRGLVFCASAAAAPAQPGAYVLAVRLERRLAVRIGGRAAGTLSPGLYLYCGSANGPGGLRARLTRHMKRRKALRWHIDQLTTRGRVSGAWILAGGDECELVAALCSMWTPIAGFGSSDCRRCRSHLLAVAADAELGQA